MTAAHLALETTLEASDNLDLCHEEFMGLRHLLETERNCIGVIIMAGTNDLASMPTAAEVCAPVQALHKMCHEEFGLKTLALSVPPNQSSCEGRQGDHSSGTYRYFCRWREVNAGIHAWAEESRNLELSRFVDVGALVPFSQESGFWEVDGLHMSKDGYRELGSRLAPEVESFFLT